jgi:hypothetical protein
MRPRTCTLSACTLGAAMFSGLVAMAADLPKEGTYSGTYSSYGTYKNTPVGKERVLGAWEEHGLQLSKGAFDHTTWHCWGMIDIVKGLEQDPGNCVVTDPEGDQVIQTIVTEKRPTEQPSYRISAKWSGGTGKYAGISGDEQDICHAGEFKAAEGTYLNYCTVEGSYKLQPPEVSER